MTVALIIIVILFVKSDQTASEKEQTELTLAEMKPVKDYVTRCLEFVVDDAFSLMSTQGFSLYESQGGTLADPPQTKVLELSGRNVSFLISLDPVNNIYDNNRLLVSNSLTESETTGSTLLLVYPWLTFPHNPFTGEETLFANAAFGWNKLKPLNREGNVSFSVEEQLEQYLAVNMQKCTSWDRFSAFKVTTGVPKAEAFFSPKNTIVTLNWDITLKDADGRSGTLDTFLVSRPIRLRALHEFVMQLIDADVSNLTFDIGQSRGEFVVGVEANDQGSVVKVTDTLSQRATSPFEVRFARENRPPALFFVNQEVLDQESIQCAGVLVSFDNATSTLNIDGSSTACDVSLSLPLRALDPDEQVPLLRVSGPQGAQLPYTLTSQDVAGSCVPFVVSASDGIAEDWQIINIKTRPGGYACT